MTPVITHRIILKSDLTWTVIIHGHCIDTTKSHLLSIIPKTVCDSESLQNLIIKLEGCAVCPGHPDEKFVQMVLARCGKMTSKDGKSVVATVDSYVPVYLNGEQYTSTVQL